MKQAVHIFQKDVRYLWREICLVLAITAMLAWAEAHSPASSLVEILWMLAAAFTIARVIHAEAIPGHNQFWTTRPYRWRSLLAAKLMFVLLFVNLPLLVAQAYIVQLAGFALVPHLAGLLWSQVLMILCFSLPITALAAMTAGIASFLFAAFLLLTLGYFGSSGMVGLMYFLPLVFLTPAPMPKAVEWLRLSLATGTLAGLALIAMYVLYRARRTDVGRVCGVAGVAAAVAFYFYTPWSMALAVQSRLSRHPFDASSLQFALDPLHRGLFPAPGREKLQKVEVVLPVAVAGVAPDSELQADAVSVTLQGADGKSWSSGFAGLNQQTSEAGAPVIDAYLLVDPVFFGNASGGAVTARASLYLTVFGNPKLRAIPVQTHAVEAVAGLRCGTGMLDQLYCRSVFRWPSSRVYAQFGRSGPDSFTPFISYSPFPATMEFNPIEQHWVSTSRGATEATIISREPLSHFRRDVEFKDVDLTSYTRPPQKSKLVGSPR